ncbi:hypothetical protein GA0070616_2637 [Micromonospora nigra]|uniref:Uncharacterized protein n=1 Tax=Micromonospora nigra TaxID=145857 RepID=A0A1C6S0C4_9ACTN|nr:hypothetical protein [Micromonospora nigra]SCL22948.1 hypothetical protein GA0070616_2637 [Micromonospora nigra]
MRETDLDGMFAEFEASAVAALRPPGVAATQHRVRQRRLRRRGLLAGITALVVAGPVGALAVAGRDDGTPPEPPPPTAAPGPSVSDRKVVVPGTVGGPSELRFVDARHAWALFDTCDGTDQVTDGCRRTLARTTDGGVTWQGHELPTVNGRSNLLPTDERILTVVSNQDYVTTEDGGETFATSTFQDPSAAARRAGATASGFRLGCPSPGGTCDEFRLVRIDVGRGDPGQAGSGKVEQPPLTLDAANAVHLVEGGDGRLWTAVIDDEQATVAVSSDQAASWQLLPPVRGAQRLLVSPTGEDVWLVGEAAGKPVWRLVDGRWQRQGGLPDAASDVAAAGGGRLVVTGAYGGAGVWHDGRYENLPELRDVLPVDDSSGSATVEVARDGTVVFRQGRSWVVGSLGTRAWTRLS